MTNCRLFKVGIVVPAVLTSLIVIAGCSQTVAPSPNVVERMSGSTAPSAPQGVGFLSDYSRLQPGKEGQAQWIYINPQAQWANYTKVIIDPFTFIASADTKVKPEDQQKLANYFYNQLKQQLSTKATIVDQPGPDVMKLKWPLLMRRVRPPVFAQYRS